MPINNVNPALKVPLKRPLSQREQVSTEDRLSQLGIKLVAESEALIKAMFYGKSGTGKTTLASSFPRPIMYIQCDNQGVLSIRRQKDVYYKQPQSFEEFEELYYFLEDDGRKGEDRFFKTIVLDTLTSWQELVMESVNTNQTTDLITQQTWGKCSARMKTHLTNLLDLPFHIVVLAQEKMPKNDSQGMTDLDMLLPEAGAYTMPSVSKILNAAVSIIGQTYIKANWVKPAAGIAKRVLKSEYCLRIGPHQQYVTKIRRDILSADGQELPPAPEYIINPTYQKIIEVMLGEDDKYIADINMRKVEEEEQNKTMTLGNNTEED